MANFVEENLENEHWNPDTSARWNSDTLIACCPQSGIDDGKAGGVASQEALRRFFFKNLIMITELKVLGFGFCLGFKREFHITYHQWVMLLVLDSGSSCIGVYLLLLSCCAIPLLVALIVNRQDGFLSLLNMMMVLMAALHHFPLGYKCTGYAICASKAAPNTQPLPAWARWR